MRFRVLNPKRRGSFFMAVNNMRVAFLKIHNFIWQENAMRSTERDKRLSVLRSSPRRIVQIICLGSAVGGWLVG